MIDALTEKLTLALVDLGDTPDAVAAYLEGQGVCGHRSSALVCPIAAFLQRLNFSRVSVSKIMVLANSLPQLIVRPPPPVADFIDRFDSGHYPQLEAK